MKPHEYLLEDERICKVKDTAFWKTLVDSANRNQFPAPVFSDQSPNLNERIYQSLEPQVEQLNERFLSYQVYLAWSIVLAAHSQNDAVMFAVTSSQPPSSLLPLLVRKFDSSSVKDALAEIRGQLAVEESLAKNSKSSPRKDDWCRTAVIIDNAEKPIKINDNPVAVAIRVINRPNSFEIKVEFDRGLLEKDRAEWMTTQLCYVLRQIQINENINVDQINLLDPEGNNSLGRWGTSLPDAVESTLHELIQKQIVTRPRGQAVCAWDGNFTYGELEKPSSALAAKLIALGNTTGKFVPILMDKSRWTVVAILGILRAGAAFVILDPAHPNERLQEISQAVGATAVITSSLFIEKASKLADEVILLGAFDAEWEDIPKEDKLSVSTGVCSKDPAYVVFTSGSTGRPKGVVIHHSAYATSAIAHGKALGLSSRSRIFQFASYAFDSSIADHLTLLLLGGCICIPSPERSRSSPAEEYNSLGANTLSITPSLARTWKPRDFHTVENLLLGGEAPRPAEIALWSPFTPIRNVYGPAECTPASTVMSRVSSPQDIGLIGTPTGCVCWIVNPDDSDKLTPLGLVGELLIEGHIVGQGYLNDPEKSAKVFIDRPRWLPQLREGDKCGRFYLTGDLVQYVGNRSIQYVGRKDFQVKLRGQRIELGEVETHTSIAFEGVQVMAEVIKPQNRDAEPYLAAFLQTARVSDNQNDLFLTDLGSDWASRIRFARDNMAKKVPCYMIPAVFIPVPKMPLNLSGKIDRRRLRDAAAVLPLESIQKYAGRVAGTLAPSTDLERALQEVWSQTLSIDISNIGLEDNFFRLGGDSLTAMQVASLLKKRDISIKGIRSLQQKTLGELAQHIMVSDQAKTDGINTTPAVCEKGSEPVSNLSPGEIFIFENTKSNINHLTETFVLSLKKSVGVPDILRTLEGLKESHAALRTHFIHEGGSWSRHVQDTPHLCHFQEHTVSSLNEFRFLVATAQQGLNIECGPLFSIYFVNWNEQRYLILVGHQLIADIFSWRIIWKDMETLLQGGRLCEVPTLSFQRWSELQIRHISSHLNPSIALPFDCPPSMHGYWGPLERNTSKTSHKIRLCIDKAVSKDILATADPAIVIQASLLHSFARVFDRQLPAIFCGGHGRELWDENEFLDVSRTVGWFTTFSPTDVNIKSEEGIQSIVTKCKQARLSLPYNGWAYFASLCMHHEGRKAFSSHAPFEVMFNYLGRYQQQLEDTDNFLQQADFAEDILEETAPDRQRFALVNVTASVKRESLEIDLVWNKYMRHQGKLNQWWMEFERSLSLAVGRPSVVRERTTTRSKNRDLNAFHKLPLYGFQLFRSLLFIPHRLMAACRNIGRYLISGY